MKSEKPKKSFLARVRTFGISRIRNPALLNRSKKNLAGSAQAATSSLAPKNLDVADFRAGLRGRYKDGGRARFAQMMDRQGLDLEQADDMRANHLRAGAIFALAAAVMLAFGIYSAATATNTAGLIAGISLCVVFFLFMALAIRHDFSAWQILARRFGGFNEYLEFRLS